MKRKLEKVAYILLILVPICVFLYCGWQLFDYFAEGTKTEKEYQDLANVMQQAQPKEDPAKPTFDWSSLDQMPIEEIVEMPESPYVTVTDSETGKVTVMLPEFEPLYAINPDVIGWITIDDTNIDYPVVQRKDKKDYYLYRDFYGRQVARGCIYADEDCDLLEPSDNVILYGHMMKDGTMFEDLSNYTSKKFWQEHPFIHFYTLLRRHSYQIVCVFKTTANVGEGFAYYQFIDAESPEATAEFWKNCRANAFYDTGLELNHGDKLLTLSTCEYTLTNGRLVVVAKRID